MDEKSLLRGLKKDEKEDLFREAVIAMDLEQARRCMRDIPSIRDVLEPIVKNSFAEDGEVAMWIVKNIGYSSLNERQVIGTTLYYGISDNVQRTQNKLDLLRLKYGLTDEVVDDVAKCRLSNRFFTGRISGSEYIGLCDLLLIEQEEQEELHIATITTFLYHDTDGEVECVRKVMDRYEITRDDIDRYKVGGRYGANEFYSALRNQIKYKVKSLKDYERTSELLPEFKDIIDENTRYHAVRKLATASSTNEFERNWELALALDDKLESSREAKKERVLTSVHYAIGKSDYRTAFILVDHYKDDLGIDDELHLELRSRSGEKPKRNISSFVRNLFGAVIRYVTP